MNCHMSSHATDLKAGPAASLGLCDGEQGFGDPSALSGLFKGKLEVCADQLEVPIACNTPQGQGTRKSLDAVPGREPATGTWC